MLTVEKSIANDYSTLTPAETAARLQTSLTNGLSSAEAFKRLQEIGPNELPHEPPEPLWLSFLKQFKEPLILLLLASAAASLLVGSVDDAVSIAIAVTIVVTVAFVQEYRSQKSIRSAQPFGTEPCTPYSSRGRLQAKPAHVLLATVSS